MHLQNTKKYDKEEKREIGPAVADLSNDFQLRHCLPGI
jgi:hypothetical protein